MTNSHVEIKNSIQVHELIPNLVDINTPGTLAYKERMALVALFANRQEQIAEILQMLVAKDLKIAEIMAIKQYEKQEGKKVNRSVAAHTDAAPVITHKLTDGKLPLSNYIENAALAQQYNSILEALFAMQPELEKLVRQIYQNEQELIQTIIAAQEENPAATAMTAEEISEVIIATINEEEQLQATPETTPASAVEAELVAQEQSEQQAEPNRVNKEPAPAHTVTPIKEVRKEAQISLVNKLNLSPQSRYAKQIDDKFEDLYSLKQSLQASTLQFSYMLNTLLVLKPLLKADIEINFQSRQLDAEEAVDALVDLLGIINTVQFGRPAAAAPTFFGGRNTAAADEDREALIKSFGSLIPSAGSSNQ